MGIFLHRMTAGILVLVPGSMLMLPLMLGKAITRCTHMLQRSCLSSYLDCFLLILPVGLSLATQWVDTVLLLHISTIPGCSPLYQPSLQSVIPQLSPGERRHLPGILGLLRLARLMMLLNLSRNIPDLNLVF